MEELEGFRRRVDSAISRAEEGGVALFGFLDDAQRGIVEQRMKYRNEIQALFYGGIENVDRMRLILSPYEMEKEDFKIHVFEIIYNKKYYELYHRSVLGALMGLGIKRECIGDIVVMDDKRVYFAASEEICPFLLSEFKNVGKAPIELKEVHEKIEAQIRYESKVHFLSSMRLDVIIAGAYNMSRALVLEALERGDVSLNHIPNQNPSHICKCEDELSVRHKGRVKITNVGGETKSGRLAVTLAKRC